MWEKLIELLLEKWLESQTPERKSAALLVTLLTNLRNCREAYVRYTSDPSDENRKEWADQVEALALSHSALHHVLDAFAPEVNDLLRTYISTEVPILLEERERRRDELKNYLMTYALRPDSGEQEADFDSACNNLRRFIQENYKLEDVIRV